MKKELFATGTGTGQQRPPEQQTKTPAKKTK